MYNYDNEPLLLDQRAKKKVENKREDKRKEKFEESKWRSKAKCRGDLSEPNPALKMNEEKKEYWFMNMKQKEEKKEKPLFENLEEQILQIKKVEENQVFSQSLEEIVSQFPEEDKQSQERREKDGLDVKKKSQNNQGLIEKKKKVKVYYHESFEIYEDVNHCIGESDSQTPTFPENPHLPVILPPHGQELDQTIFVEEVVQFERQQHQSQSSTPSFQRGPTSKSKQTRVDKEKKLKSPISKRQEKEKGRQSSSGIENMLSKVEIPRKSAKKKEVDEKEAFSQLCAQQNKEKSPLTEQQSPKSLFNIKPQSHPSLVASGNPNNKSFYQQPLQSPRPQSTSPLRPTPNLNIDVCFSPNPAGYSKLLQGMVKTNSRYWPSTHQLKWITRDISPDNSCFQGDDIKHISMMGENEEISQMLALQFLRRQQAKRCSQDILGIDSEAPHSDHLAVPYIAGEKMNKFDWAQLKRRVEIRQITRKETLYREIADMSFEWVQYQTPPKGSNSQKQLNFEYLLLQHKDGVNKLIPPCPPVQSSSAMITLGRDNCQQLSGDNSELQRHLPSYRSIKFKEISKFYKY